MNMAQLVMALAFAATLLHGTAAVDLVVGGNTGWTIPPNNTFYSNWASANTFRIGNEISGRWLPTPITTLPEHYMQPIPGLVD